MSSQDKTFIDAKTQAKWFSNVRKARETETTEDYVELIADLIENYNECRLSDLAKRMGITHATASKVVARLKAEDYVESQPYRSIFLTKKGEDLARECKERHEIVLQFLIKIGVPPEIAEYDAEGIEHHISDKTLKIFQSFNNKK